MKQESVVKEAGTAEEMDVLKVGGALRKDSVVETEIVRWTHVMVLNILIVILLGVVIYQRARQSSQVFPLETSEPLLPDFVNVTLGDDISSKTEDEFTLTPKSEDEIFLEKWRKLPPTSKSCAHGRQVPMLNVIGGKKCGTTTFWANLRELGVVAKYNCSAVPDLPYCGNKEPHFFDRYTREEKPVQIHDKHYMAGYPKCGKYLYTANATPRNALFPDKLALFYPKEEAKNVVFVYIVCDPVRRLESDINYTCLEPHPRTGKLREQCNYKDHPDKFMVDDWISRQLREGFSDRATEYKEHGRYAKVLRSYRKHFPQSKIIVIQNKFLFENQQEVMDTVLQHLHVDPVPLKNQSQWKNRSPKPFRLSEQSRASLSAMYEPEIEDLWRFLQTDERTVYIPHNESFMDGFPSYSDPDRQHAL
jgi:hypothetical protein